MKLTIRTIDTFFYEGTNGKRDVRWDESLPGFGIRIYPSGNKVFVLSFRVNGRKRLMTLGKYGVLTLAEARNNAKKALAAVIDGNDPLEDRIKASKGETMKELCATYMELHSKPNKKSWKDDQQRIDKYILPKLGNIKVKNIKRADVAFLHSKIGNTHTNTANRVLELLSKMFNLAKRWGYLDDGAPNAASNIDPFKENKRDRWINSEELPRLASAIEQEKNLYARNAIWLYLLTGVRKTELLTAKWEDIDWQRNELKFENTKSSNTHYVPLNKPAMTILTNLPRITDNPYILPGKVEGQHLVNISKPWLRIRKAAGIDDVRLHDLRRTVGSWLAQSGNTLHLIGRVLNHSDQATTAIYARFGEDNVRQALEDHGEKMMALTNKKITDINNMVN